MSVTAEQAAKYLCQKSGWSLTHLKIQKLLYLANMVHLGRTGEPLIKGAFEATIYGPIHPGLYDTLKIYGTSPVRHMPLQWLRAVPDIKDTEISAELDKIYDDLGDASGAQLVAIIHSSKGAWFKRYVLGGRIPIREDDIKQEYANRFGLEEPPVGA